MCRCFASTGDGFAPAGHPLGWSRTATDCSSGRAVYQAWHELYPAAPVYLSSRGPARTRNFGSITFTGATVNGATLGSVNPTALDPSANGVYEAGTGALSGGASFSMTYLHE